MTNKLLERLADRLGRYAAACPDSATFLVALSGGVDSVTLLAAAHRLGLGDRLRCIHVDHRLHRDSPHWSAFCRELAAELGVEFLERTVRCDIEAGSGLEAAARQARYEAFAAEMRRGDVLLTAHHADDQLETLLYRLVRGTGVDGLRGIREFAELGPGYLLRPWLTLSREEIVEQARQWGLRWLEDPSNEDMRFDRNYLRRCLLPGLVERWPGARLAAARLAAAAQDAAELGAAMARVDLGDPATPDCLPLARLAGLSAARLRNVLRHAIRLNELPMPDSAALERLCTLVRSGEGTGTIVWPGAEAHRLGEGLYLRAARTPLPEQAQRLEPGTLCRVAEGHLELQPADAPALPDAWVRSGLTVRFRAGGERFQPHGSERPRELREWMREARLLPWMRDRIPLVYHGSQLVAVADLGISASAATAGARGGGWRIVWRARPRTS